MELCKTVLESQTSNNLDITEFDAVGVSTAKKLQRMNATQAIFAESLITAVLKRGLLNSLSDNTKLCDGCDRVPQYSSSSVSSRPPSVFSHCSGDNSQPSVWHSSYPRYTVLTAANNNSEKEVLGCVTSAEDNCNNNASSFYESATTFLNN